MSVNRIASTKMIVGSDGSYIAYRIFPEVSIIIDDVWRKGPKTSERVLIQLIQQIMKRAVADHLTVFARVDADSGLHLFFLKMGMVPDEFSLNYAAWEYGEEGYSALMALYASDLKIGHLKPLQGIIQREEKRSDVFPYEVFDKRDLLLSVLQKKLSFLRDRFFPRFFALLNSKGGRGEFPDCSRLGSVNMSLTEMGRKEWEKSSYSPFHTFEHLVPFMTKDQQVIHKSMFV